jgi:hypothetical protein
MDFDYEVIRTYVNDKSSSILIKKNSVVSMIWSNAITLPFIFFTEMHRVMTIALISVNVLTCLVAALAIIFTKYNKAYSILFFGIVSFGLSLGHLFGIMYLIYYATGISSSYVLSISIIGYLVMFIGIFFYHYKALDLNKYYRKKKTIGILASLLPVMSSIGLAIGKSLKGSNQTTVVLILAACLSFFVFVFIFGTHNIFKFMVIKRYSIKLE